MSTLDVRKDESPKFTEIRFSDDRISGLYVACIVEPWANGDNGEIRIRDGHGEYVVIRDKEHADNLRKALDAAEQMGWLK